MSVEPDEDLQQAWRMEETAIQIEKDLTAQTSRRFNDYVFIVSAQTDNNEIFSVGDFVHLPWTSNEQKDNILCRVPYKILSFYEGGRGDLMADLEPQITDEEIAINDFHCKWCIRTAQPVQELIKMKE